MDLSAVAYPDPNLKGRAIFFALQQIMDGNTMPYTLMVDKTMDDGLTYV